MINTVLFVIVAGTITAFATMYIIYFSMKGVATMNENRIELVVFRKRVKTKEGKAFPVYLSHLTKKSTGEIIPVTVKFTRDIDDIASFPAVLLIDRRDANLSSRSYGTNEYGESLYRNYLWVKDYVVSDRPYEDKSLEDFV